ncbi:glycosyl transferase [Peziza echinospora]|nr:glycosyl transferase [Peziza echinospora]
MSGVKTPSRGPTPPPRKSNLTPRPSKQQQQQELGGDAVAVKKKKPTRSVSFALPALPFPLASILHPLRSAASQWLVVPVILMVAFLFRWAVGLGAYSGMGTKPMYGDLEAQRHWMEITAHLPIKDWYYHDIQWWGLDYPPLTAYHSLLLGKIGSFINPEWFALYTSRGLETPELKVYLRATVIASEYLVYIPAVVIYVRQIGKRAEMSRYDQAVALAAILFQPALMLIDHGHFQYNSVMLGLTISALCCFITDRLVWGSGFFVASLCFKQMGLYYAPAIFAYLLGLCVFPKLDFQKLFFIGLTVITTFTLIFAPLVYAGGIPLILQSLHRVFPFARGLWEDKVANAWCTLNIVVKLRERFEGPTLQKLSLLATLLAILPPCGVLFMYPKKHLLPLGLSACAWGFFLFSFQVHEKSVLLPLMPLTLLYAGGLDRDTISWVTWLNTMAVFSMWPLLKRDGLALQYTVLTLFWAWLMGGKFLLPKNVLGKIVHLGGYACALGIHVAEVLVPKERLGSKPDLWVVGNVVVSFGVFVGMYLWTMERLWRERGGLGKRKRE